MSEVAQHPSYATCVAQVLSASTKPLTVDRLLAAVAEKRPLGKGARSAIYRAINKLFQAVPVAPGRYGWLSHLLTGMYFRHPLTGEEARKGYLLLDELEHIVFSPQFFQSYRPDHRAITIELFGGPTVNAEATIERKTWSLNLGQEFVDWLDEAGGQSRDDIIISVVDAVAGLYAIRLNLREMRDESALQKRNMQLSLLAEEIVAEDRTARAAMPTWELVARLIGRGYFADPLPPDDLHYILHEFSMLRFTDGMGYQLSEETSELNPSYGRNPGNHSGQVDGLSVAYSTANGREPDWTWVDESEHESDESEEDSCARYQEYMEQVRQFAAFQEMLSHEEFHLLEAELEMLVRLEQEFGHLLDEQENRKQELSLRLFIDPTSFLDADDWDISDDTGQDDPPFWAN